MSAERIGSSGEVVDHRVSEREARNPLLVSTLLTLCVWNVLLAAQLTNGFLGEDGAVLLGFAVSTALLLVARPTSLRVRVTPSALLGFAAGYASWAAWVGVIGVIGLGVGLEARTIGEEPTHEIWVASIVFAPVFEELLYRERLLPSIREKLGSPLAIILSSFLFAIPHLESWSVLGTFLVGLLLGTIYLVGGSLGLCIGVHAGLNLAALACGPVVDARLTLLFLPSLIVGGGLLLTALGRLEARRSPRHLASARSPSQSHRP